MRYRIAKNNCAALLFITLLALSANGQQADNVVSLAAAEARSAPSTSASTRSAVGAFMNPLAGMSVADAVKYALAHNKNLQADYKLIAEAEAKLKQAGLKPNPMLETSGLTSVNNGGMRSASVMLSLPLEFNGRRERRIAVAQKELARMQHEVADRERRLANEVRLKYGDAVEIARNLELSERLLELGRQNISLVKARVTEGASAPLEQSLMQVEVSRFEAQRTAYESRLKVLIEELKNLLGMGDDEPLLIQDEFIERPASLSREQALALAFQSRPDLLAARAAEDVTAAMIEMAKAEGRFDLSVFAELGQQAIRMDALGINRDTGALMPIGMNNTMVRGGVTIMLPTRNKNQGNIEAAVALSEAARLRREFIESVIRREIAAAWARCDGAAQVLKTYDNDLLAAAQNNLRVVRSSFDLGYARLNDVLSEQQRLIEVQMGYTAALKERYAARAELETVLGAPLDKQ